ncbi:serine/threonine-protein kinase [Millisia brevis]|uniref:serine/threonine-protein kinase n=1 Tax=Millisia brevis TaxID=264148 RepID=UPI0008358F21|nr:serine/threonine-protein kinase [Millisia brevis]
MADGLRPGDVFAGYTIETLIGQGGMGRIYRARHPRLPRAVALKMLTPTHTADPTFVTRFEREADHAARVEHPNVVTVYDRGFDDGHPWISMQFISGSDAAATVIAEGPLAVDRAVYIVSEIARGLDHAHSLGVLHRDVKPANIMLSPTPQGPERVLLTDFGIAKAVAEETGLTETGTIISSLPFAAPEVLYGRTLDGRTDQYALAATLFALLSGAPPFPGPNQAEIVAGHLSGRVPALAQRRRDVSPALDAVIERGMAKESTDRFPSCADFAAAARAALRPVGPALRPTEIAPPYPPPGFPPQGPGAPSGPRSQSPGSQPPGPASVGRHPSGARSHPSGPRSQPQAPAGFAAPFVPGPTAAPFGPGAGAPPAANPPHRSGQPSTGYRSSGPPPDGYRSGPPSDGRASGPPSDGRASGPPSDGYRSGPPSDGRSSGPPSDGYRSGPHSDAQRGATPPPGAVPYPSGAIPYPSGPPSAGGPPTSGHPAGSPAHPSNPPYRESERAGSPPARSRPEPEPTVEWTGSRSQLIGSTSTSAAAPAPPTESNRGLVIGAAIAGVVLLIAAGITAFLVLGGGSDSQAAGGATTTTVASAAPATTAASTIASTTTAATGSGSSAEEAIWAAAAQTRSEFSEILPAAPLAVGYLNMACLATDTADGPVYAQFQSKFDCAARGGADFELFTYADPSGVQQYVNNLPTALPTPYTHVSDRGTRMNMYRFESPEGNWVLVLFEDDPYRDNLIQFEMPNATFAQMIEWLVAAPL